MGTLLAHHQEHYIALKKYIKQEQKHRLKEKEKGKVRKLQKKISKHFFLMNSKP